METIGAILIVGGFLLGVFGGLTLSRSEILFNDKGELNKEKQMLFSLVSGGAALAMLAGFVLFFGGF